MPTREFTAGSGFEIAFKSARLDLRSKRNSRFDSPRAVFRSMNSLAWQESDSAALVRVRTLPTYKKATDMVRPSKNQCAKRIFLSKISHKGQKGEDGVGSAEQSRDSFRHRLRPRYSHSWAHSQMRFRDMKKYIFILSAVVLIAACEQKETTINNPPVEKKESNTTIVKESPAPSTRTETKTNINVTTSPTP